MSSLRTTVRALPTVLRVGFSEAVAYRAEMLVWVLSTTMPLVMMALWTAVAREAPIGRFGEKEFVAYFLATFIVRQLTGSWAAWQMNFEVKQGILSMRLLRPFNPIFAYASEHLSAIPLRVAVAIPVALIMLAQAYGYAGQTEKVVPLLEKAASAGTYTCPYESAAAYVSLNDTERALSLLNDAVEKRSNCLIFLRMDPRLKVLHEDPRYGVLLTRVGLDDAALASYKR